MGLQNALPELLPEGTSHARHRRKVPGCPADLLAQAVELETGRQMEHEALPLLKGAVADGGPQVGGRCGG
eukprot:10727121-Lingulodinium_polyedra.AAC.1